LSSLALGDSVVPDGKTLDAIDRICLNGQLVELSISHSNRFDALALNRATLSHGTCAFVASFHARLQILR